MDIEEIKNLLRAAIACIEGLAEQQAMTDNYYQVTLQRLKKALLDCENAFQGKIDVT